MFSGIGGFELGIGLAALKAGIDATCVGYSEIDGPAIATYEEHFEHHNFGDITAIDAEALPDFNLLVGGFPCQAFSVAGKRGGFEDTRGTLFFDVARIIRAKRPRHFILENVKGLLSHDAGRTLQTILGVLTELGYCVEWQVLNSKNFGVPQNRERIYLVGHHGGLSSQSVFPFTGASTRNIQEITNGVAASQRVYERVISPTLNPGAEKGGAVIPKFPATEAERIPVVRNKKDSKVTYSERDIANCIDASYGKGLDYHGQRTGVATESGEYLLVRKLTPTECERLQGFPDSWTIGSDTQRYRQCGNAVTTNVVEAVMDRLIEGRFS